ncbi:TPA: hypothetical protein IXR69_001454 [Enterococcus faecium]|uniref:hypothetical protein n=1 Tax=Enterococcus TaxID=1350 RepID=UPI0009C10A09|nr:MULTISPECIES: hypothetical protein [Enterococcus]MBX9089382.1 hypothetical protein [Enterococcus faecium]MBX9107551.1 hypothetical protein [Enterococcus faecium]MCZ2051065.1 hypothetical protein [Enterococcus faecium]MCZ2160252.1 hypothetical protein [Enterococcus faecium]MDC4256893.1 hypothetical protein [Enterococcus faecium]
MADLFGNNYFFLYIFACITIFNYSSFKENQKIIILYLTTFGMGFLKIFDIGTTVLFLIVSSFLFLEILTQDDFKMKIITKVRYKLLDYLFLIIFQYGVIYVILSILLTSFKLSYYVSSISYYPFENVKIFFQCISILLFITGIVKITSEKFKIKNINELISVFMPSINMVTFDKIDHEIFNMLIDMEDKTFRIRANTYNFFSLEFLGYKLGQFKQIKTIAQKYQKTIVYVKATRHIRGYSTIEMQLIRSIGIMYGYNITITRKIYEMIYTTIFLKSLRNYYVKNTYANHTRYKDFLIYTYLRNVNTKIGNKYYPRIIDFIGDNEETWSKEKCYIAFSGLPHRAINSENILSIHPDIIEKYQLNKEKILKLMDETEI